MKGLSLLAKLLGMAPDVSTWSWATVTDDSPLRVQLDGETAALDVTPDTLIGGLAVGARVWVQLVTNANPARRHRRLVILGAATVAATVTDAQDTSGTTTSTSYTETLTGATAASVVFVAPASGKVLIHNAARMVNSGASDTRCSFIVRTGAVVGSGSTVVAEADARSIIMNGASNTRAAVAYLLTGLTPGASYNVRQSFIVAGGTGTYAYRRLIVEPVA